MNPKPSLLLAALAVAATTGAHADDDTYHAAESHHSPHIVGAFVGATDPDHYPAEMTFGLEYEYKGWKNVGLGLIGERTDEGHHGDGVDVLIGAAHYHIGALRLTAGIGKEWVGGHGSEALQRLGVAYDIDLGPVALAPTINVDFVDGEKVPVYGLVLLKHF